MLQTFGSKMTSRAIRLLVPMVPLVVFTVAWLGLVFAEVKLNSTIPAIDYPLIKFVLLLVILAATWGLARKSFTPSGRKSEIRILALSIAGTLLGLIFSVILVVQFHVWLGGTL